MLARWSRTRLSGGLNVIPASRDMSNRLPGGRGFEWSAIRAEVGAALVDLRKNAVEASATIDAM